MHEISFTKTKKQTNHTICFSKRELRFRPWDLEISSKAFIVTGATEPSSRLSTTRFLESCTQKNQACCYTPSKLNSLVNQGSYHWFIEDSVHIIKVNISLFESRWLISFLKPLILNDLSNCNSLFQVIRLRKKWDNKYDGADNNNSYDDNHMFDNNNND